jgi:Ca2+-transporting ATPase
VNNIDKAAVLPAGLTSAEAERLLHAFGPNVVPDAGHHGIFSLVLGVLREPMFLLLVVAAGLYLVLGDFVEGAFLSVFAVFDIALVVFQERRTERALEALRDLSAPHAVVIRDGRDQKIPGKDLVPGDLFRLIEGDRVAADALVVACSGLQADESLLTGESVPVRKAASDVRPAASHPGGDDLPLVYSGTLVVSGQGLARVLDTGSNTQIGKIGASLRSIKPDLSPLQKSTARLVKKLGAAGLAASAIIVVLYGVTRGDWMAGALAGISLAMSALPEEFPMVLIVFLAMGALRLSRYRVLTRRPAAIETLGAAAVLCVDKTGTLTCNSMRVAALYAGGQTCDVDGDPAELSEPFHEVLEFGILASKPVTFDPMDVAVKDLGEKALAGTEHLHRAWNVVKEYELKPGFLATSQVWRPDHAVEGVRIVAAKGAPEAVADLCRLTECDKASTAEAIRRMAGRGLRVLAVAKGIAPAGLLPPEQQGFDYSFVGLIGYSDPIRLGVADSVAQCRRAGVAVAMITGDYPATALAIGREAGLDVEAGVLTGAEMAVMTEAALIDRARKVRIFARMMPAQKLDLVRAFKAAGRVVAMTGDGVNDAPALKAADIGIAMGRRGTDVAREAADLVLLDDDFNAIVRAVLEGRRIYANLRRSMRYLLAVHVPIAGLALIPVALGWPVVFFPAHIVFMEMIIDPVSSIGFEAEPADPDAIDRPPRPMDEPLFRGGDFLRALLPGVAVLAAALGLDAALQAAGRSPDAARTAIFAAVVFGNLALLLASRSTQASLARTLGRRNRPFWIITGGTLACLAAVSTFPPAMRLFHFAPAALKDLLAAMGAGLMVLAVTEAAKFVRRRTATPPAQRAA